MRKPKTTSGNLIPEGMTLATLFSLATIQMATGIPLLNAIQPVTEEDDVKAEQRFKVDAVGKGYSSSTYAYGNDHIAALKSELKFRKSMNQPVCYIRISGEYDHLPRPKIGLW